MLQCGIPLFFSLCDKWLMPTAGIVPTQLHFASCIANFSSDNPFLDTLKSVCPINYLRKLTSLHCSPLPHGPSFDYPRHLIYDMSWQTFELTHENNSCSAFPKDQDMHLTYDMWNVSCSDIPCLSFLVWLSDIFLFNLYLFFNYMSLTWRKI